MPYTLDQLEAFVSSPHYDADTAGLIARGVPVFPRAKEQLAKGISRIRGNLCNVHGKYGPCDKGLSADGLDPKAASEPAAAKSAPKPKPKPAKAKRGGAKKPKPKAKPKQTPEQQIAAQAAEQAKNMTKVGEDTGLDDHLANLDQFSQGKPLRPEDVKELASRGLLEIGSDGTPRKSSQANGLLSAAKRGDVQGARDAVSRARDQVSASTDRAKRQQDAAGKRATAQVGRELAQRDRLAKQQARAAEQAKKKPAKASADGSKQPEKPDVAQTSAPKPKRAARSSAPSVGGVGDSSPKPKPAAPKPAAPKEPAKQVAPALTEAAQSLSDGKELSDDDTKALVRNGLAKLDKDGALILTAAGMRVTTKSTFKVFKDANGQPRWVAQSSTAFQDRDREIVSTKALSDDVAFADESGSYGPLRWWHTPGLDLGDCDFNAMHGRVLIESGTFRSPAIAQKVAQAASGLEISLGFLHLPNEPDADGVFHHIRRFERSLVPRGKASNRFTAFTVKESAMFDPTKVAALKTLGFSDDDIAGLQSQAAATEKTATDQGVAFKADDAAEPPDLVINGITYKAFPLKTDEPVVEAKAPLPGNAAEDALDGGADDAMEEEVVADENALTLSAGDLAAISEAIQAAVATIMGGLDLEKKVASHVQGFLQPMTQAQTTKDAEQAQTKEQLSALAAQVAELTGDQPAARPYRASQAKDNVLTDATMLAAAKQLNDPTANDPWADIKIGLGLIPSQ